MNHSESSPVRITETWWRGIILALSGAVIIFTIWCLSQGITTIFMHLYYFPIVLLAYRYRWKGCILATLLALAYLGLVMVFDTGEPDLIFGALYRLFAFVGIAAVIAYLSECLVQARNARQQSTELREQYLSLAPAIVLALDRNGIITFINRKGAEILECRPDEVIGKSWSEKFLPEKDRERVNQVILRIRDGDVESNRVFENPVLTCTGAEKIIRWYNTVLHDEAGAITGIVGFGEDITEEKWAQNALREMQQFQENVIANANVWISVLDPDGTLLVWNDAAEAISGYKKTGVLGKNTIWKQLYPDKDYRKKVTAEIQRIIGRDTNLENFETEIRCADGTKKTIVWNTRGMRDNSRAITSYIAIGRDVSAQKSAELRAGESSRFLATMIDTLPMPIFFKDAGGKYLGCNPPFEEYIGVKRDNLAGKTAYDISPKDLADQYTASDRQVFDNPVPLRYETQVQYADGSRHDVIFYKAPFFNTDGSVGGLIGAFLDITERKRMEEVLRESEEKFRQFFNNVNDAIYLHSLSKNGLPGKFLEVNDVMCRRLGYSRDEFLTMAPQDIVSESSRLRMPAIAEEIAKKGQASFEMEHRRKDGTLLHVEVSTIIFTLGGEKVALASARDITDRKRMEQDIIESRQLFADIISFLPDPTFVIDKDGRVLAWNRALEQLSGVPAGDIIGKGDYEYSLWIDGKRQPIIIDLVIQPDQDASRMNYTKIHREGRTITAQTEIIPPGSEHKIVLSLVASPLIDSQGKITGAIESMRDITRLIKAEAELARINQNLEQIVRDRTRMLEDEVALRMQAENNVQAALDYTRSVIEANPDLIVVLDEAGVILDVNAAGELLTGIPAEKLIGTPYFGYLVEDGTVQSAFAGLLQEGMIENFVRIRHTRGTVTPLSVHATVIRGMDGKKDQIIVAAHDITRQKQDEEAIRSSQQMLTNILENFPGVVFWKDKNSVYLGCNRNFSGGAGLQDPVEIIGKTDFDLPWAKTEAESYRSFDREVMDGGKSRLNIIETQLQSDGRIIWLDTSKVPLFGPDGTVIGILGTSHDITRQKQNEEMIQASLEEKVLLLREVHHRVKNNLQIIISLVNLQMRQTEDPVVKQIMSETQNRVRAMSLVHEKLYRSESLAQIDFADYSRYLATQLFSFYGIDTRRVGLELAMSRIMVDINTAVPLGLLLNELISNALKHAFPEGREGTITIGGSYEGNLITLVVRDNGIGIPAELDWKSTTSLGMRLITSLIDQVDGTIVLDREKGTTFTLTLKREPVAGEQNEIKPLS